MNTEHSAEKDVCAFALGRGLYCMRPAGHEALDGRLPRHDSTPIPPAVTDGGAA